MEPKGSQESIVTQISVGGFDRDVRAKDLLEFLEHEVGVVYRCRLKTSWTPPDSYPDFLKSTEGVQVLDEYRKVEPHAFVHFALPESASWAKEAAKREVLAMGERLLKVSLGRENPYNMNMRRRTTAPFKLPDVIIEIGALISPEEFWTSWRGPRFGVEFLVDPFDGTCRFCFTRDTVFSFKDLDECCTVIKCNFKMEFFIRDINEIIQYADPCCHVLLLQLASSPRLYYRTADDDIDETVPFDMLDDDDPWIRTTDFTPSGAIGRCNCYRISISPRHGLKLKKAINYLKELRIQEVCLRRTLQSRDEPNFGVSLNDHFFSVGYKEGISFDVLYLLSAVVHKNIFSQHQLSDTLFDLLRAEKKEVNLAALKHICSYKRPVFDACGRLKLVQKWLLKNPNLLRNANQSDDVIAVGRVVITPSKAYCLPPEVELSNRVLRNYKPFEDRFLRVTFMDEGFQTLSAGVLNYYPAPILKEITSNSLIQKTTVFRRVKNLMSKEGFYLCGRKYSFLAFSSNQLRDRSAWFFAEDQNINVKMIKTWMGKFNNNNIAKCAARMGQCFSSTYATVEVPSSQVNPNLPDIERNGYCFSDGIGTITPDLAREVAEKLKLELGSPSAYQIRYAGYKGVVACWPGKDDGVRLSLRKSMNKFWSDHTMLEICSWTRFQPGFLNRQIVTLLSTLKVPDEIFWKMQQTMITKLDRMLLDTDVAFDVLMSSCAEHGNTAALMLSAGFRPQSEPHLRGMLTCVRAAQLWGLREKARIFVPEGRWLMGCFDELAVLEQGQCFIQVSRPSLENCFVKHGSRFSETKSLQVVKGYVVVAKNPCLHPGDIRILEAVDAPGLHHLYDCIIFPQNGERPHTNEASGSDLDGDLYFVTWDEKLIPPSKKSWPPMEYEPPEAKKHPRDINQEDIANFFVQHILNENLGTICNAHVVHADRSEEGASDKNCLKLAELAAIAVDFPKTGKLVTMPYDLKPKLYPDFMGKQDYQSYKSKKILGRLYRQIKDDYGEDAVMSSEQSSCAPEEVPYDSSLEVPGSEDFLPEARDKKRSYDGQLNGLLAQYKVTREEEVVTGHVWSMPSYNSRKQGDLKERLKHSYSALRKEFRQVFETITSAGTDNVTSEEERNKIFEKKASAWYQVTYHPKWVNKSLNLQTPDGGVSNVMLSFAWIAADYLVRIKIRTRESQNVDLEKPVNSLMGYLADRI